MIAKILEIRITFAMPLRVTKNTALVTEFYCTPSGDRGQVAFDPGQLTLDP